MKKPAAKRNPSRNWVAKHARAVQRSVVMTDKKKELKKHGKLVANCG